MLTRIFVLASILLASLGAATIDSGSIFAYGSTFGTWDTRLASSGGHYSISMLMAGVRVLPGPQRPCECWDTFPYGFETGFRGWMFTEARNVGSATINGVFYPFLVFDHPNDLFRTSFELIAPRFRIDHEGHYSVPFSMTGVIQAALTEAYPPQFVLYDAVTGHGTVEFSMWGNPSAGYHIGGAMLFTFAAPEPNSLFLVMAGLLAAVGAVRRRW